MEILNIVTVMLYDEKAEKVLLLYRNKMPYKEYYAFPGGKLEFGETLVDAARREIKEETGLSIEEIDPVAVVNEIVREEGVIKGHFLLYYFVSKIKQQEVIPTKEGKLQWVDVYDLPSRIIPSDLKILQDIVLKGKTPPYIDCELIMKMDEGRVILTLDKWDEVHKDTQIN